MPTQSAGLLLYRHGAGGAEIFLIHMGGPIWTRKDATAWSIPKGILGAGEDRLTAAIREFREETGFSLAGNFEPLGTIRQNSGKDLTVWAVEGDCDPEALVSNTFQMEWPPKSGKMQTFPEADRGGWFDQAQALEKIVRGQRPILDVFFDRLPKTRR